MASYFPTKNNNASPAAAPWNLTLGENLAT